MFARMSLKAKLFVSFAFMGFLLLAMGGTAFWGLTRMSRSAETITSENMPKVMVLGEMRAYANAVQGTVFRLTNPSLDEGRREFLLKYLDLKIKGYEEADKKYTSVPFIAGEKELYDDVNPHWKEVRAVIDEAMPLARSMKAEDHQKLLSMLVEKFDIPSMKLIRGFIKLTEFQNEEANRVGNIVLEDSRKANTWMSIVLVTGLFSAFLIGFLIARSLTQSLSHVSESLIQSSTEVRHISGDLADASHKLSQGATEQAAALQETASSLDEVQAMVAKNSENATHSSDKANTSLQTVERSYGDVQKVIAAIEEIKHSNQSIAREVAESQAEMSNIVSIINEIGAKTKVINDIVFQTKLLSFNASVEAARAGEHGKGFAVVAEEVGNLAAMSGQSAKEIGDMLSASITKVESSVEQTKVKVERIVHEAESKVENGVKLIHELEQSLQGIREQAHVVQTLNSEISRASQEQSQGVSEINKAINQLDTVTQENANAAQKCSTSAEVLTTNVEHLARAVESLNSVIHGQSKHAVQHVPTVSEHKVHTHESTAASSHHSAPSSAAKAPVMNRAKSNANHSSKKKSASVIQMSKSKPAPKHHDHKVAEGAKVSGDSTAVKVPNSADPRFEDV